MRAELPVKLLPPIAAAAPPGDDALVPPERMEVLTVCPSLGHVGPSFENETIQPGRLRREDDPDRRAAQARDACTRACKRTWQSNCRAGKGRTILRPFFAVFFKKPNERQHPGRPNRGQHVPRKRARAGKKR
jgi:hypothetical protein